MLQQSIRPGLSRLCCYSSPAAEDDYNDYSNTYNVWTYSFQSTQYEEQYIVTREQPEKENTAHVCLADIHKNNTQLPTIISPQFTAFLESLTRVEYTCMVRPILYRAIKNAQIAQRYYNRPHSRLAYHAFCIPTELFTLRVKHLLERVFSIIFRSIYLEIITYNAQHLWYDMYWSLNTSNDNISLITYDGQFDNEYLMCFNHVPIKTLLDVQETMEIMLESGNLDKNTKFLNNIAAPWMQCIDREYQYSLGLPLLNTPKTHKIKTLLNDLTAQTEIPSAFWIDEFFGNLTTYMDVTDNLWADSFFHNLTNYIKAATMTEYMLNNINNLFYEFNSPNTIKEMLDADKPTPSTLKPLIYSLYLPLILQPYIFYIKQIEADVNLFGKELGMANLTLDITAFNESVNINGAIDKMAVKFIQYQNSKAGKDNPKNDNLYSLGEFVKYATINILKNNKTVHSSLFRRTQNYKDYNLAEAALSLVNSNNSFRAQAPDKPASLLRPLNEKIRSVNTVTVYARRYQKPAGTPLGRYRYHLRQNDHAIEILRARAPSALETKKLLWIIQRASVARRPPQFDIQQLNKHCKTYNGTHPITDSPVMVDYLNQLIHLYFKLRYLRPYDFYAEEQAIVKFIKFAYYLHNLRSFTYFQAHLIMYLQQMISILTDVNFRYNQANQTESTVKIQFITLACDFTLEPNDMTAVLINLRTILGGKKLLNRYAGESPMLYKHFLDSIEQNILDNPTLEIVYRRYRTQNCINLTPIPVQKLYAALNVPYFRIYATLQDPVVLAKIVDDLLLKMPLHG